MFRSILRSLSKGGSAQAARVGGQNPERESVPIDRARYPKVNLLSMMCSKQHEGTLEVIAKDQSWSYARARTWSEGLSAVATGTCSVVVMDRAHLRAEWRAMLAFVSQPEHHCRVILIDTPDGGHLLKDEFLDHGGHACLRLPLHQAELISAIQDAAVCWQKIDRAYGRNPSDTAT